MAMTVKYLWRVSKKKRREGLTKSGECEFCSIMGRLRYALNFYHLIT